ncbi:MAG TPA: M20/M25/M40 family metallo-hydrolase [Vicinamibacterales bacterium]|nr:M20/M25/M40 family metallo-hydrolase [Vicinamibacterales bacterium]
MRVLISLAAAATLGVVSAADGRQALTASERQIVQYIDDHQDEAIALLERAVNINSGTQNLEGVRAVGALFRAEFDALGFRTEWIDGSSWNRAGHLVATHAGPGPKILLIGHLDTVFERDSPFQRFERLPAGQAKGPGIIDMKGGDVIIVQVLKALRAAGRLASMNIVVVMTGDEEEPGRPLAVSRAALREAATGAAAAIGFEDGDGSPERAVVARRGTTSWRLTVTGRPAHSSQVFSDEVGAGAIYETARILDGFRQRLSGERFLTFNPGVILGGTSVEFDPVQARGTAFGKTNVVAERTVASGDLRALTVEQFERAKAAMQDVVRTALPHTSAELTFDEGYPPLAPTAGNERLLALFDRASRDLGLGGVAPVSPDRAGAADVSFVADLVPMIIDAAGLKGRDGHTVNETADLEVLAVQAKRAAITIARLAGPR